MLSVENLKGEKKKISKSLEPHNATMSSVYLTTEIPRILKAFYSTDVTSSM